ncbi:MAG: ABC transporter ATP-binding protein [Candidatus Micrarchaeia archaeon]
MKAQSVIESRGLVKEYPLAGGRSLRVLQGLSFTVDKGDFVAIMGPSGSGKSTMLHLLGCLDHPTGGAVFINGVDSTTLSSNELADLRAHNIGFVFQSFNLLSNLTALENVEVAMSIAGLDLGKRRERALALLSKVGLEERAGHKPMELSGGERQRVALARALANNPPLLLMDEPTGNLDSKSGEVVMELIDGLWRKGLTLVLITHERDVAEHAERIMHLRDGAVERVEVLRKRGVSR